MTDVTLATRHEGHWSSSTITKSLAAVAVPVAAQPSPTANAPCGTNTVSTGIVPQLDIRAHGV
jgi:hypothetical protein